jgi:hypothetical protein
VKENNSGNRGNKGETNRNTAKTKQRAQGKGSNHCDQATTDRFEVWSEIETGFDNYYNSLGENLRNMG